MPDLNNLNPINLFSRLWAQATKANADDVQEEQNQASLRKRQAQQGPVVDTVSSAAAPVPGLAPVHGTDSIASAQNCPNCVQTFTPPAAPATTAPSLMLLDSTVAELSAKRSAIRAAPMAVEAAKEILESNIADTPEIRRALAAPETPVTAAHTQLDNHIDSLSKKIDEELLKPNVNFEKLQAMVYKLIMLLMRRTAKADQEFITEMGVQIKAQTAQIKDTYNTWPTLIVTVVSAGVSIGAGGMGFAQFMPTKYIAAETAKQLALQSQTMSNVGTSLQSLTSLASNRSEGQRQVFQMMLQRIQGKEEDRKGAKHKHGETGKEARDSLKSAGQTEHDTVRTMLGGN